MYVHFFFFFFFFSSSSRCYHLLLPRACGGYGKSHISHNVLDTNFTNILFCFVCQGEVGAVVHEKDESDILGKKKASYLDYVDLWRSIMDPTKLKVSCGRPLDCHGLGV